MFIGRYSRRVVTEREGSELDVMRMNLREEMLGGLKE